MTHPSVTDRGGVALGAAAYLLWGLFPAFFHLLGSASPVEVLAHRVLWTLVLMAVILSVVRGWAALRSLPLRVWAMVGAAAALIAVNWGLFIYATAIDHVVEVALGYFIGPLVSVLLGVFVLHERLRPLQWAAVGIAAGAVLLIAAGDGRVPWLGLGLAVSFATYGLIKKTVPLTGNRKPDGRGTCARACRRRLPRDPAGSRDWDPDRSWREPRRAPGRDRPGHGGAAPALRRGGPAHPAHDAGHAAVPGAHPAVPARRRGVRRADARRSGGSGSGWCGRRW